jgi:hypothetical protein
MNKHTKSAKQFVSGCAGMTAGAALILLGYGSHGALVWNSGVAIWFITEILSSSEENAARCAPLVVIFLLAQMVLVVCGIYDSAPSGSGTHQPSTGYVTFVLGLWVSALSWECWMYFYRRSPKNDDHVA